MQVTCNQVVNFFFITSLILLPFENLPYLSSHTMARASFFTILPGLFLWFVTGGLKRIYTFHKPLLFSVCAFSGWTLLCTIINIYHLEPSILTGTKHVIKTAVIHAFYFSLLLWSADLSWENKENTLELFTRGIMIALILCFFIIFVELCMSLDMKWAKELLITITPFFLKVKTSYGWYPTLLSMGRARAFFSEPSHLAFFLIFGCGFALLYQIKSKSFLSKFIVGCSLIALLLTKSRLGYGASIIFLCYVLICNYCNQSQRIVFPKIRLTRYFFIVIFLFGVIIATVNSTLSNSKYSFAEVFNPVHTTARFEKLDSELKIMVDNPFFGTGFLLSGPHCANYLSGNGETRMWKTAQEDSNRTAMPTFSMTGTGARSGVVGLMLLCWLLCLCGKNSILINNKQTIEYIVLNGMLIASIIAWAMQTFFISFVFFIFLGSYYGITSQSKNSKLAGNHRIFDRR